MTHKSGKSTTIWTIAITSLALFMVSLDNLVVTTALPVIRRDLHATISQLEWTVNAYTLTFAVLLLTGAAYAMRFPPVNGWQEQSASSLTTRLRHPRTKPRGSLCCSRFCGTDPVCWCSTILTRWSSQLSARGATERAMPVTADSCKPSAKGGTIAASW